MNTVSERLYKQYGELLTLEDIAKILRYPTADAVRKSLSRGALILKTTRLPKRRELFVKTEDLIKYLESTE